MVTFNYSPFVGERLIVSQRETELFLGDNHWFPIASSGIALCDFAGDCRSNAERDRVATLVTQNIMSIELTFSVSEGSLPVGSYVNFKFLVYGNKGETYQGEQVWEDGRNVEYSLLVEDGAASK